MGITYVEAAALRDAAQAGVRLGRTLTLGRQWLLAAPAELARALRGCPGDAAAAAKLLADPPEWADDLFRLLGATDLAAMDVSDYEGATVLHDLNAPIPDHLAGRFDFVFDGGTSEHVFDVARVFQNLMGLLRVGGHLLTSVPANNQFGHGFYQFSPELLYRVYAPENGFEVVRMTLTERWSGRRYEAADPKAAGRRIEMLGTAPLLGLTCLARKVAEVSPFARPPMQSDYQTAWEAGGHRGIPPKRVGLRAATVRLAERWAPWLLGRARRRRSLDLKWHPDLFRPLDD